MPKRPAVGHSGSSNINNADKAATKSSTPRRRRRQPEAKQTFTRVSNATYSGTCATTPGNDATFEIETRADHLRTSHDAQSPRCTGLGFAAARRDSAPATLAWLGGPLDLAGWQTQTTGRT